MKILIAGATGFIGSELLDQCIKHNYITHIYCLTRKPLEAHLSSHAKVTQILHDDFTEYPAYVLAKLGGYGIEACVWAAGGASMAAFENKQQAEKVNTQMPITAAEAFASALATRLDPNAQPGKGKFPFRFVFLSAWGAEQDQFRSLWMWADSRKIKGAAEKGVFDVADNCEEVDGRKCFEAIALRAGGVIGKGDAMTTIMSEAVAPYIAVDRLAKTAIKIAMQGTGVPGKRILENGECLGDGWADINNLTI